jgi:hypothetical protein
MSFGRSGQASPTRHAQPGHLHSKHSSRVVLSDRINVVCGSGRHREGTPHLPLAAKHGSQRPANLQDVFLILCGAPVKVLSVILAAGDAHRAELLGPDND